MSFANPLRAAVSPRGFSGPTTVNRFLSVSVGVREILRTSRYSIHSNDQTHNSTRVRRYLFESTIMASSSPLSLPSVREILKPLVNFPNRNVKVLL